MIVETVSSNNQGSPAGIGQAIGKLALAVLRISCVPIHLVLAGCEPVVRIVMLTLSVLGILSSLVLGLSGAAPRFPFGVALLVFAGLGAVPVLYRAVLRGLASV